MKTRIHSKGDVRQEEFLAAAATIYPGMLINQASTGKVAIHASEGEFAENMIAAEDALQGKTVADAYAAGAVVPTLIPNKGTELNVLIQAGQEVDIGDSLVSGGDGTFIVSSAVSTSTVTGVVLYIAAEALDLTGTGAVNTLCAARAV